MKIIWFNRLAGNHSVDLGGQWVHGQDGNAAYELANPLGLLDKSDRPDFGLQQEFFDSAGNPLSDGRVKELENFSDYVYKAEFDNKTTYESIGEFARKMYVIRGWA